MAAGLIRDTRDALHLYKGEQTLISCVRGEYCPACRECLLDAAESERVMSEMRARSKRVDARSVDQEAATKVHDEPGEAALNLFE